jgi:hypothetical protein
MSNPRSSQPTQKELREREERQDGDADKKDAE